MPEDRDVEVETVNLLRLADSHGQTKEDAEALGLSCN
jgi:hypothetical protein